MPTQSLTTRTAAGIRQDFLDFFHRKHGHAVVPSAPVVPLDDPTLLFTNAGMNQFKDVFLGRGQRDYCRAVNSQKVIRAGGKHNDLEDVGADTYHHTFFEMLGNWSFGDYFKTEAIEWAWELLTEVWGLDPERLHVTTFAGDQSDGTEPDDEAASIWSRFVAPERHSRWGRKDNFWEMGETGPCGPCSEIHYDGTPDKSGAALVNRDDPRVVELWNLVFIQFNRAAGGTLSPLPARHVDTGMGLERLARVLQGVESNYDTDLFTPIFKAVESHTGVHPYRGSHSDPLDIAYRVIADHIRCLTVAITDGARPSSDGRGYVLRRILRRAIRHAHQTLQTRGAWLHQLVPAVVTTLGDAFPELKKNPTHVAEIIHDEEESFLRTLDRGLRLFDEAATGTGSKPDVLAISADDAFKLHDTYGFPIDLTRVMAEERGLTVDIDGYETLMEAARQRSRAGAGDEQRLDLSPDDIARLRHLNIHRTEDDDKYHGRPVATKVKAIFNGRDFDEIMHEGSAGALVLARTNHYAESGGQVGDAGSIETDVNFAGTTPARGFAAGDPSGDFHFAVDDTQACGEYVLHIGRATRGKLRVGENVHVVVDRDRRERIRANHSATHLLNHALREVLGADVDQKGSLVADDRLRFDFSCPRAMTPDELRRTGDFVNEKILEQLTVHAADVPLETARTIHGVRAVFGERYPDPVRVVSIGASLEDLIADPANPRWQEASIEFCGGTHLASTEAAERFVILSEQALAAGVRRIIAVTGAPAIASNVAGIDLADRAQNAAELDDEQLVDECDEISRLVEQLTIGVVTRHRIEDLLEPLRDRLKSVRKAVQKAGRAYVLDQARSIAQSAPSDVLVRRIEAADMESLRSALDIVRAAAGDAAVMLLSPDAAQQKVSIVACVAPPLIEKGLKAGDWVREAAKACDGSGGGRPDMAQAGGKDAGKIDDAIAAAEAFAEKKLR